MEDFNKTGHFPGECNLSPIAMMENWWDNAVHGFMDSRAVEKFD